MKKSYFLILPLVVLLLSCEKKKQEEAMEKATLTSNEPVKIGERLYVWVERLNPDYTYRFKTPKGEWKDGYAFETQSARASDAGIYTIEAYRADSTKITKERYVEVQPVSFNCSPKTNSMDWPTKFIFNFNEVTQGLSGGNYYVRGKSSRGYLTILFDHPEINSFYIQDGSEGEAFAYVTDNSGPVQGFQHFIAEKQYIHVRKMANGNMAVILCDALPVNGQSFERIDARLEF